MTGLTELAGRLRQSVRLVILSGAGVSAESGIPTFRDAQSGLWARYRPEDLATPEAFRRDPELVWRRYQWRRELIGRAAPNPGHLALAELERRVPSCHLVTQNVDGLHQRAGSRRVIEFHGNIRRNRCAAEGRCVDMDVTGLPQPPPCPACGALLRPDVVWFGEAIPATALQEAQQAVTHCDLMLVIGTSGEVQPAAGLATIARQHGARIAEINPATTPLTPLADHVITGRAAEILPRLVAAIATMPSPSRAHA